MNRAGSATSVESPRYEAVGISRCGGTEKGRYYRIVNEARQENGRRRSAAEGNLSPASPFPTPVKPRQTREIRVGNVRIGGTAPIAVQSMTATRTQDSPATIRQVELLEAAGADVIRIAIDNPKDVAALAEIRAARRQANLVVDLQENYRLAEKVAQIG